MTSKNDIKEKKVPKDLKQLKDLKDLKDVKNLKDLKNIRGHHNSKLCILTLGHKAGKTGSKI